jgi:hypothetical protein
MPRAARARVSCYCCLAARIALQIAGREARVPPAQAAPRLRVIRGGEWAAISCALVAAGKRDLSADLIIMMITICTEPRLPAVRAVSRLEP